MAFHHQAVETEVHGLLAKRGDEFSHAADMARVAEDRQIGDAAAQFYGDMPHRRVAIEAFFVRRKTAMDNSQARDACAVEALYATNPKFKVGIDGVLHKHRHIYAFQGICQGLHREGIGHGTRTYPKDIHLCRERSLDVLRRSHFGRHKHTRFLLDTREPGQADFAHALKAAGLGAGFPNACAKNAHALACQLARRVHYLFFGFGGARAGYDYRPLRFYAGKR